MEEEESRISLAELRTIHAQKKLANQWLENSQISEEKKTTVDSEIDLLYDKLNNIDLEIDEIFERIEKICKDIDSCLLVRDKKMNQMSKKIEHMSKQIINLEKNNRNFDKFYVSICLFLCISMIIFIDFTYLETYNIDLDKN